jgi:WhiB family transcriptional regulator, redox-sensing transcriptional regulator
MTLNVATTPRRASIEWRVSAACRFAEPELFFPVSAAGRSAAETERAKSVCARCPVRRECLQFALATRQAYGVWGGMSEEERRTVHLRTALFRHITAYYGRSAAARQRARRRMISLWKREHAVARSAPPCG